MRNSRKSALVALLALACSLASIYAARHFLRQNQARERAAAAQPPAQAR